ncbi:MAG: crossover junction endodeoxyribonuclease RuvC [Armatimonadota bacterium]|nr:crossover junction endodeoxyribonuclease RuvC [bacterium]
MKILGLDPGESTGFALIEVAGEEMNLIDYGEIPVLNPGLDGLLESVWFWLTGGFVDTQIAFEEFIASQKLRTTRESVEVRGVIRLYCRSYCKEWAAYYPATVRSQLGVTNKREARDFINKLLGFKLRGRDHVSDALAVALCHALKLGLWTPHIDVSKGADFSLDRKLGGKQVKNKLAEEDVRSMSSEELRQAMNSGKIKIGR